MIEDKLNLDPPSKILFEKETYEIRGAIFEVYKEMGCGFLESVYQECLEKEFTSRKIPFLAQQELRIHYKQTLLTQSYKPDFICHGKIILELKATRELADEHKAQIFNYLKATGYQPGLLINFGHHPKVQILRIVK